MSEYADNIVARELTFNTLTDVWTTIGTGTAIIDNTRAFEGNSCLKITNTDPVNDLTVSNSAQITVIPVNGKYDFAFYLFKKQPLHVFNFDVQIYQNAVLLGTVSFEFGTLDSSTDIEEQWQRFFTNKDYSLTKGDRITFRFIVKGSVTGLVSVELAVDGFMMYNKNRLQIQAPLYSKIEASTLNEQILQDLKNEKGFGFYVDSLVTPSIIIDTAWTEITIDGLGGSVTSALPLEIRGVSDLLTNGKITPISVGDDYDGRLDVFVSSKTGSPSYLEVIIDFADSTPDTLRAFTGYIQQAKNPPFNQSLHLDFFTLDTFFANGGRFYARTDAGSYTITTRNVKLSRKSRKFI